ncbi:MAG: ribosome small subunit-dependent GTPase A [Flammeovirgaceae bacterium]
MVDKGLIIRSTGLWYDVKNEDTGEVYKGRLRGKLKLKGYKLTNPIAVGDYVEYQLEDEAEGTVLITKIIERQNFIVRQSTRKRWHGHMIAANIDQALLIVTLSMPRTSLGFIDRFLVAAESSDVPTIIVFNKADLLTEDDLALHEYLKSLYESLGYQTILISALEKRNLEGINDILKGKKSLVAGHSGVGKSTLLNAIAPKYNQKTAEVSSFANKGVHTTTFAEMFEIEQSTYLIDTPGIKELGIMGLEENQLGFYFPEIRALAESCKYYNCSHTHEPGCAVVAAVERQEITPNRYHSYLSILEGGDNRR